MSHCVLARSECRLSLASERRYTGSRHYGIAIFGAAAAKLRARSKFLLYDEVRINDLREIHIISLDRTIQELEARTFTFFCDQTYG